jgi:hypothetical protein
MTKLTNVIVAKDCHIIDCSPQYKTNIEGCNDDNEDIDFTNHEISTVIYTNIINNNNTNVIWVTFLASMSVILTLVVCVTVLR